MYICIYVYIYINNISIYQGVSVIQGNLEYLIENMNHRLIQIFHPILVLVTLLSIKHLLINLLKHLLFLVFIFLAPF